MLYAARKIIILIQLTQWAQAQHTYGFIGCAVLLPHAFHHDQDAKIRLCDQHVRTNLANLDRVFPVADFRTESVFGAKQLCDKFRTSDLDYVTYVRILFVSGVHGPVLRVMFATG
jgi:hypothetical protein